MLFALLFLLAVEQPQPLACVVLACDLDACTLDTPEGTTRTWRRRGWRPGLRVACPATDIEPT